MWWKRNSLDICHTVRMSMAVVGSTLWIASATANWPCHLRNSGVLCDVIAAAAAAAGVDKSATDKPTTVQRRQYILPDCSADWGGFIYAACSIQRHGPTSLSSCSDWRCGNTHVALQRQRAGHSWSAGCAVRCRQRSYVGRRWNKLPAATTNERRVSSLAAR